MGDIPDMRSSTTSLTSIYSNRMMASVGSLQSVSRSESGSMDEHIHFLCNADPGTRRGRRMQNVLLLTLPSVPVLVLALVTIVHMSFQTRDIINILGFRSQITDSQIVTNAILNLNEERALSFLQRLPHNRNSTGIGIELLNSAFLHTDDTLSEIDMQPSDDLEHFRLDSMNTMNETPSALNDAYNTFIANLKTELKFPETQCPKMTKATLATIASLHLLLAALKSHENMNFLLMETVLCNKTDNFVLYDVTGAVMDRQLKDALMYTPILSERELDVISSESHIAYWNLVLENETVTMGTDTARVQRRILSNAIQGLLDQLVNSSCTDRYRDKIEAACAYIVVLLIQIPLFLVIAKNAQSTKQCLRDVVSVYASRTVELKREKRRSDHLLAEMLPKSVAKQLKSGKSVHAEQYNSTTVYFSDIADFADISHQSEPMDVVNLLNNIYNFIDAKINMYDVYKMETIGSVYMVVSGLPVSNDQRHVVEVANLALDILQLTEDFTIPHLPNRSLQLRIGIHSGEVSCKRGPCCAGVVGNKMPRYCLFGDTINTASRMQSYGQAGKIHISKATRELLSEVGGFAVEPRGLIDIKGKGSMYTFWLVSKVKDKKKKKKGVILRTNSCKDAWVDST